MMMRKIVVTCLMVSLIGSISGCGSSDITNKEFQAGSTVEDSLLEDAAEDNLTQESSAEETSTEEEIAEEISYLSSEGFEVLDMGIPSYESYKYSFTNARNPWDMIIENGKLYVGSGDYSINTGPVDIWCCDLTTEEWYNSGEVPDEAVQRFVRVNGQILAPGIDPKGSWMFGNYYALENDTWNIVMKIPRGVHMYDIVEFDGTRFYGIGTDGDNVSPVQATRDGDETFEGVPFYEDGELLFGQDKYWRCRVYDFFIINEELYCLCRANMKLDGKETDMIKSAIYKYEDGGFHLHKRYNPETGSTDNRQIYIYEKVLFRDAWYFSNGRLRRTTDFLEIESLALPDQSDVEDLYVEYNEVTGQEELYILSKKRDGAKRVFRSTIWKYIDDENFEEICYFEEEVGAMSFAKHGDDFYVGLGMDIGTTSVKDSKIGTILKIGKE